MSSGIIFINKAGVAVAADSAVTIGNRKAIFNTAQKIFPIGQPNQQQILVITFDNANFMGVPIELILKSYSKNIQDHGYYKNSLEDYMNDFIRYVEENQDDLKLNDYEERYLNNLFYSIVVKYFHALDQHINEKPNLESHIIIEETLNNLVNENQSEIERIKKDDESKNLINESFINKTYPNLLEEVFRDEYARRMSDKNNPNIDPNSFEIIDELKVIFENYKKLVFEKLKNKNVYQRFSQSGIYFVGFGQKSIYPSYYGFSAMALLNRKFVYENDYRREVTHFSPSHYKTLAQDDTIEAFIIGVNFNVRWELTKIFENVINEKLDSISEQFKDNPTLLEGAKEVIKTGIDELHYFSNLDEENQREFKSSLSTMGVMDMAEYAESLISLQSLKRKYDLDTESNSTVGGPTDVAIITKYDGFKWIKFKNK